MEILKQLGDLLIGSVPTAVFFILLVIAYQVLVGGPLTRMLAEREARTTGALEHAREAIAKAESETAAYEAKLRAARAELAAAREARLKEWAEQRERALGEARAEAQQRVNQARAEVEASAVAARRQIEEATATLSEKILAAVMPAGPAATGVR